MAWRSQEYIAGLLIEEKLLRHGDADIPLQRKPASWIVSGFEFLNDLAREGLEAECNEDASEPITLSWPEVRLLAVAPAARGQGVGAALMKECMQRARHSGTRALALHTTDIKNAATRLYERMGFQRAPELDFEPAPGVTAKGYLLTLEDSDS